MMGLVRTASGRILGGRGRAAGFGCRGAPADSSRPPPQHERLHRRRARRLEQPALRRRTRPRRRLLGEWPRQRARREARIGARPRLGAFVGRGVAPFAAVAGGGGGGRRVALRARRRAGAGALDSVRPARASRGGRRRAPLAASLGGPLHLVELDSLRGGRRLLLQPVSLGRQHCPAATASRRGQPGRRPRHRPPGPAAAPSFGARLHRPRGSRPRGSRRAELVARVRRAEARGE